MTYYLVRRFGSKDQPQFRKEPFRTEADAVSKACSLLAAGNVGDFLVEDDKGDIVANDLKIRNRYNATRTPQSSN